MSKYFVTGGSGFIGSSVVKQFIEGGYEVLALARSDESAKKLEALGAEVVRGELKDVDILEKAAKSVDGGVVHLGFIHDFGNYKESADIDTKAIETFLKALKGTNKALVGTGGTLELIHPVGTPPADENTTDFPLLNTDMGIRGRSGIKILESKADGIKGNMIKLSPTVHGGVEEEVFAAGFAATYILQAIEHKVAVYIGDGLNAWTSIQRDDAAALYVAAAVRGIAGHSYHGVAEEAVTWKALAETVGKKFGFPVKSVTQEEAGEYLGPLGNFAGVNATASSEITKKELGWEPKGTTLLEEILAVDPKKLTKTYL